MSEKDKNSLSIDDVPEAVVRTKKQFSIVWLVPLVAALIGAWLAYKAITEKGPTIAITFKSAEGLEAEKTKIKYKNVELGQIENIELSDDLSHIIVTAQLVKQAEEFLSENTRFWVVRARVAAGQVSGLGTLFSGAYIGMDPGKKGSSATCFTGLETPPVITTDLPGRHFLLHADRLASLDYGSPVYYRQIKVGQVVGYKLVDKSHLVDIKIFINAPYHKKVRKNTVFWEAGGIDFSLDANGIEVHTASLVSLMIGGISFDTPANAEPGEVAEEGDIFRLYKDKASTKEKKSAYKRRFLLYFDGSVRGLSVGAPVEFRGLKIGEVLDIKLQFDPKDLALMIPVVIEIEADRFEFTGGVTFSGQEKFIDKFVERGLRARLQSGNLLTGQLFVDFDFYPDEPAATVAYDKKYPEIPTIPTPMEEIRASLTRVLDKIQTLPFEQIGKDVRHATLNLAQFVDKLNALPIEQIGHDMQQTIHGAEQFVSSPELQDSLISLNKTITHIEKLTDNINTSVTPELSSTLGEAQETLKSIEGIIGSNSPMYYELQRVLAELANAARSIRIMADYLERHPDALIYGKEKK